jgi:hypothetical protein
LKVLLSYNGYSSFVMLIIFLLSYRVYGAESEYSQNVSQVVMKQLFASVEHSDFHYFPAEQQGSRINRHLFHFLQRSIFQHKENCDLTFRIINVNLYIFSTVQL